MYMWEERVINMVMGNSSWDGRALLDKINE